MKRLAIMLQIMPQHAKTGKLKSVSYAQAAQLLRQGKVGVIPTDTVYGVVALAADQQAVARLYALKHRTQKPGTLIAASLQQLKDLGFGAAELSAAEPYFTAGTSVIVMHPITYLHQGLGDQAVRLVCDETLQGLLDSTGPLQTSSANTPGMPPADNLEEAYTYFGDAIDFYVDGGDRAGRGASAIIRVKQDGTVEKIR